MKRKNAEIGGNSKVSKGRGRKRNSMKKSSPKVQVPDPVEEEPNFDELEVEAEEEEKVEVEKAEFVPKRRTGLAAKKPKEKDGDDECRFIGKPVSMEEARRRWPHRYQNARKQDSVTKKGVEDLLIKAKCHYFQAKLENCVYDLYDCVHVKAEEGEDDYIGRIVEFFETQDKQKYFAAQWFFRAKDTVIKDQTLSHDERRVFLSKETDDNVLDCIVSKVQIIQVSQNIDLSFKTDNNPPCDYYYDMLYSPVFSTFANLSSDEVKIGVETSSSLSSESDTSMLKDRVEIVSEASLLDLYSGCGAMSTGLCHGAQLSSLNLQTRWAVDLNSHACESLKLNHPNTEVRNEKAEDFLSLLQEWAKLCQNFGVSEESASQCDTKFDDNDESASQDSEDSSSVDSDELEVEKIVGICYGETENLEDVGLKYKVRWKGYGSDDDTWEPANGLSKCQGHICDFVRSRSKDNFLPLPGKVDVICGGPPCQGVSGFNRFRNVKAPLEDPKNHQLIVFMDIVEFLKPKYVLMENVVDILKFAGGHLGRYAISRLVGMNYQARLGIMPAGSFGLPQFRLRAFLWGAYRIEKLPQFPLPTHDVVPRGGTPNEFELNVIPFREIKDFKLERALLLEDAISDLPMVANDERRDEMEYENPPQTNFQRLIRQTQEELLNIPSAGGKPQQKFKLFDHRPLKLKVDDFLRVCKIPKKKGANFRNLPGLLVGPDNVVQLDPKIERPMLPSGKPLVPEYAISFVKGKSLKPFGRLWWDETVATVVTRAEPHNQAVLHPQQDRVLTVRENARLQGFPDYYKLCGPIKERYIQVGNAVAVPVARALGYALGLAYQDKCSEQPTFRLPPKFPDMDIPDGGIEEVEDRL